MQDDQSCHRALRMRYRFDNRVLAPALPGTKAPRLEILAVDSKQVHKRAVPQAGSAHSIPFTNERLALQDCRKLLACHSEVLDEVPHEATKEYARDPHPTKDDDARRKTLSRLRAHWTQREGTRLSMSPINGFRLCYHDFIAAKCHVTTSH